MQETYPGLFSPYWAYNNYFCPKSNDFVLGDGKMHEKAPKKFPGNMEGFQGTLFRLPFRKIVGSRPLSTSTWGPEVSSLLLLRDRRGC